MVGRIILRHQDPRGARRDRHRGHLHRDRRRGGTRHHRQFQLEPEGRAAAGFAGQADVAAHELQQLAGDGQPQPGAAVLAGRRTIGLREGLEQERLLRRGQADARVPHLNLEGKAVAQQRILGPYDQLNPALFGKLDRIAHQVYQHLLDPSGVPAQCTRQTRRQVRRERQAARLRLRGQQRQGLVDLLGEVEFRGLDPELAGLDLGEVQDVVDDRQEVCAAGADHPAHLHLLLRQGGVQQQICHAEDAIHRGTDLVAHVGEELRLHPRGFQGPVPRAGEILLQLFARGDVLREHHDAADGASRIMPRLHPPAAPLARAIGPVKRIGLVDLRRAREAATVNRLPVFANLGEDLVVRPADDGAADQTIIFQPFGAVHEVAHLEVKHRHRSRRMLREQPGSLLVLTHCRLRLPAGGDIAKAPDAADNLIPDPLRPGIALNDPPILEFQFIKTFLGEVVVKLLDFVQELLGCCQLVQHAFDDRRIILGFEKPGRNLPDGYKPLVERLDVSLVIYHQNAVSRGFKGRERQRMRPRPGQFRRFHRGDISHRPEIPGDQVAFVPDGNRGTRDPDDTPILTHKPILEHQLWRPFGQSGPRRQHLAPVLPVQGHAPVFPQGFLHAITGDFTPAIVHVEAIAFQVCLADAHGCQSCERPEPLFALAQCQFGPLALGQILSDTEITSDLPLPAT